MARVRPLSEASRFRNPVRKPCARKAHSLFHLARVDAQRRGSVAIDIQHQLRTGHLHIAANIRQSGDLPHMLLKIRGGTVQLIQVRGL